MECYSNPKIKSDICNKYHTLKYFQRKQSFQQIEKEYEHKIEDDIENQLEV